MEELDKLIEAVEVGIDLDILDEWGYWIDAFPLNDKEKSNGDFESDNASNGRHAWKGSLDAAKALHDALLPNMLWSATPLGDFRIVSKQFLDISDSGYQSSNNPARSWLIAILKAYRSDLSKGVEQ